MKAIGMSHKCGVSQVIFFLFCSAFPPCPFVELHRCAVFCLLQLGGEIFDTDMVIVDRTLTDICFDNTIVL